MPCSDVTERLSLTLDHEDRVIGYELTKQTCGGSVAGRGLIRELVKHQTADEVAAIQPEAVLAHTESSDDVLEYLRLKHLFSIQAALAVFGGNASEEQSRLLTIEPVDHGPDDLTILATVHLEVLTDKIKACGLCDGCGE